MAILVSYASVTSGTCKKREEKIFRVRHWENNGEACALRHFVQIGIYCLFGFNCIHLSLYKCIYVAQCNLFLFKWEMFGNKGMPILYFSKPSTHVLYCLSRRSSVLTLKVFIFFSFIWWIYSFVITLSAVCWCTYSPSTQSDLIEGLHLLCRHVK